MDEVLLSIRDGVAEIVLNRPEKLNALSSHMRATLGEHINTAAANPAVHIVLLRGEGRAFCSGADLESIPDSPLAWRDRVMLAQVQHTGLMRMSKVVVVAVQGAAFGGGASLALVGDILVLSDDARLGFPFVQLGVVPDGGAAFLLQAKAGPAIAHDVLLSGGVIDANEAKLLGLTRRVVPPNELLETSRELARTLSKLPPEALMLTKAVCRQCWTRGLDAALAHEADAFGLATATDGHKVAITRIRSKSAGRD